MSGVLDKGTLQDHQPNGQARTLVLSDPAESGDLAKSPPRRTDAARIWADDIYGRSVETMAFRLVKHCFRPHTHPTLMLGLIESGTKAFARERVIHTSPPGSVSIVNPGDLHTGHRLMGEELRYRALYLPLELLALAAESFGMHQDRAPVAFQLGVIHDLDVYRTLLRAHDAIVHQEPRLTREQRLLEGIRLLVGRHSGRRHREIASTAAPIQIRRAQELIETLYAQDLSIADLATAVGMSPYHLMRQFRRYNGIPMHAYQIQTRVERAKHKLACGMAVSQVALNVGFADQSHFSKRFKDLVGASPAAYQRGVCKPSTDSIQNAGVAEGSTRVP